SEALKDMRVLMTGATGMIGKELALRLVECGARVTVVSRSSEDQVKSQMGLPVQVVTWDLNESPIPNERLGKIDFVVHLAGENIAASRWSNSQKKRIRESRTRLTKNLVSSLKGQSIKRLVSASAIGFYGNNSFEDKPFDESSACGRGFLSEVVQRWEESSQVATSELGCEVAIFRIGVVLKRGSGFLLRMESLARKGLLGKIGSGKMALSWIAIDDLVNSFLIALENESFSGIWNAVSPGVVSNSEFVDVMNKLMGNSFGLPAPKLAVKAALGEMSEIVLSSQVVSSSKLKGTGFDFLFPTIEMALERTYSVFPRAHVYIDRIWLNKARVEVFDFFSRETNLEKITPEFLNFKVVGKSTPEIEAGTEIDYRLKIHGFPAKWKSLIQAWEPPEKFVDTQIKGPYKLWHHEHTFRDLNGGTLVEDRVHYLLPMGVLGDTFGAGIIQGDVEKIFSFRKKSMQHWLE
ncbi:MAG: TIGR01777 family oxidoreductase, partial [Bdellovibrionales bacterium]|nr:TIGR01777 family oxidoreductase [Bdellovibrionales bacterium]